LNYYLNEYFNNINLRYLTREELLKFIKKCVMDFKVKKRDIMFYKRRARKILYEKLREKMPLLKNDDVLLLCDIVESSPSKESIYDALGLDKPKKRKVRKKKKSKVKKIKVDEFLNDHFSILNIK